ncbi:hypothetical protein ASPBRDRAFT_155129 [Aspergillus brasiliensis CBS 101740]|uniref:Uncharacterized protein n=1 Tax=Aspergillus brasiliensis (strain CBS 101740 / IMI 381727 / IBT 21946) TaxID=767769 RepID=A0A1L9UFE1_ASPBC|nr:hypothetical protein ASPBRDRAFT_155129 [Aspergillus brasiliensis CBS 101740]
MTAVSAADHPISDRPRSVSASPTHHPHSQDDLSILDQDASMPIAIVGMGFRGPGDATDVARLWTMMVEGREAWSEIPASRWNHSAFFHPDHARHGTINVHGGHFLAEDVTLFDAPFFNMTGDEVAAMDPQQRLLLEVTYEGLENAGIPLSKVAGSQTSCFVGCFNADYTDLLLRDPESIPMYQCTNAGQSRAMTANRISYFFDLKGPSVTVDTACSGSLVALHLACQSLRTGEASMAIAAGVNVILCHEFMSTMTMMKFLSPNGRCRTFDKDADGYARGEAIGCLVLKPLKDAVRDGDHLYAVIRGSGSNQDGRTAGITLPNGSAQESLVRRVYQMAGLCPMDTEFVEAHGTGTQAGDPIEAEALARVFGPGRTASRPLRIGSIKTNVGHLEGTSGVAGIIKAVLMLENRMFLPNRNFDNINPRILLDEWKLKVQLECQPWDTPGPHRVSVNSFGYGGSNAHVILEDAWGYMSDRGLVELAGRSMSRGAGDDDKGPEPRLARVYMLSAFSEGSLKEYGRHLRAYLLGKGPKATDDFMNSFAYTLNERRTAHLYRVAILGTTATEVSEALQPVTARIYQASRRPNIGFVFTGQGAQWYGMGKGLMALYPIFRQSVHRLDAYMATVQAPFRIAELLEAPHEIQLNHPVLSQTLCSALQIALVDLLSAWGIQPDSVTGHSSGEVAAAYAVGALTMEDAISVAYYRGVAVSDLCAHDKRPKGAMLALGMPAENAQSYIDQLETGKAFVACINSPTSVTISGDLLAIEEIEEAVRHKEVFSRRLAVEVAYHSHHMESVCDKYLGYISHVKPRTEPEIANSLPNRSVAFFSSVSGIETPATELGPQYWVRNLLGQVRFAQSLRTLCFETRGNYKSSMGIKRSRRAGTARKVSINFLAEIGPHAALSGPIQQIIKADSRLIAADITYVSALERKDPAATTVLAMVATLASSGFPVNLRAVNEPEQFPEPRLLKDLPSYPWDHSRSYWAEPRSSRLFRNRKYPRTDILGVQDVASSPLEPRWRNIIRMSESPWLGDHRIQSNIVYPAAGYIAMAIEAVMQIVSGSPSDCALSGFRFRDILIQSALVLQQNSSVEVITALKFLEDDYLFQGPAYEFHINSVSETDRWTEHCRGVVAAQSFSGWCNPLENEPLFNDNDGMRSLSAEAFYHKLSEVGLDYGPCFANITQAYYSGGSCVAEVTIPDIAAVMPMNFQYPHLIHPCTLDAIIHSCFIDTNMTGDPAVPVLIDELSIRADINSAPGSKLGVNTQVIQETKGEIVASILVKENRTMVASINGLHFRRLDRGSAVSGVSIPKLAYMVEWNVDPDLLSMEALSALLQVPDSGRANASELERLYEVCALSYFQKAVEDLGEARVKRLPRFLKLYLEQSVRGRKQESIAHAPELDTGHKILSSPDGSILCAMGQNLSALLQGQSIGPTVSNDQSLWDAYWEDALHDSVYESISKYLGLISHKDPMASMLEIDAGTGQSSWRFLRQLTENGSVPQCSQYTLTSPDETIFEAAARTLSAWERWVAFKKLDITGNLASQGFGGLKYDVVIVPYGLHRVSSIHVALDNIRSLLKPAGHLVLINSLQSPVDILLFADRQETWIDNRSTWSKDDWDTMLRAAGFSGLTALVEAEGRRSMMITRPMRNQSTSLSEVLLIAQDGDQVCARLRERLLAIPLTVKVTDFHNARPTGKLCIVMCNSEQWMTHMQHTFEILKQIFLGASGVLWVSGGSSMSSETPDANLITGFARTARSESAVRRIVTLNLSRWEHALAEDVATLIYRLIERKFLIDDSSEFDNEYAAQDGLLLFPRIREETPLNRSLSTSDDLYALNGMPFHNHGALKTVCARSSHPRRVHFAETLTTNLAADHVHIRVHAASLSKRDGQAVFSTTSIDHALGSSCSGVVEIVGKDVQHFAPGDRVTALGRGTVTNVYGDRKTAFHKMPPGMSFQSGAGIPEIYCLAFYAVHHLAQIQASERVLIHMAAKTVGQAISELLLVHGAHVSLFVETEDDKSTGTSYGIPDDQILLREETIWPQSPSQWSEVAMFDVVVNCDYSDIRTHHSLWNHLRQSGRFVQFCDRQSSRRPGWLVPRTRDDVVFATFSLDAIQNMDSEFHDEIWEKVGGLLSDGRLQGPVNPATYAISEINEALDELVSDQPLDLVVLTAGPEDVVQVMQPKEPKTLLRSDAAYMLIGGLGGIGRATALWMANHGARCLVFVSRSGSSSTQSQATVCELQEKGVQVLVHAVDISNSTQVEQMVSELAWTAPPIRGAIQAAMVLRDIHIEKMTLEDYNTVLGPKHAGTWNLHNYLPKSLDWFIMLSSISRIIGNATQAAYAAGSTFMDAFAAYRNSLGLPSISLDLGVITDVGYLAENPELASKMEKQGFQGTDTTTLMSLIKAAIESAMDQTLARSQIITGLGTWNPDHSLPHFDAPLFAHFRRSFIDTTRDNNITDSSFDTIRDRLQMAKSVNEATPIIYSTLSARVASHLSIPMERIDPNDPITEYGIDSHIAVELRNWILKNLEGAVSILEILSSGSLMDLAGKIAKKSTLVKQE